MARHRTAVDWDNTFAIDAWPKIGTPSPGAVDAMHELIRIGANPFIFTSRISQMEIDEFTPRPAHLVIEEKQKIREMLDSCGLPYVPIWDKPWKPFALAYIDDRAIRYTGRTGAWDAVVQQVKAKLYKEGVKF